MSLQCDTCGLVLEKLALRCPRCLSAVPVGCTGNCREFEKGFRSEDCDEPAQKV